jgi:hypothetical protein
MTVFRPPAAYSENLKHTTCIHIHSETSKNYIHSCSLISTENCAVAVSSWLALLFLTVNLKSMKLTTIPWYSQLLAVPETPANIVNTEAVFITAQPRCIHIHSETSKNCIHSCSSLSTENCPVAVSSWLALLFLKPMKLTTILWYSHPLAVPETPVNKVNTKAVTHSV